MNKHIAAMLLGVALMAVALAFVTRFGAEDAPPVAEAPDGAVISAEASAVLPQPQAQGAAVSQPPARGGAGTQAAGRAVAPQPPALAPEWSGAITGLSLRFRNPGMFLSLEADRPVQLKYFILSNPDRLVVDIAGRWQGVRAPAIPGNNLVKSARVGRQGNADRLVLDMFVPLRRHELRRISATAAELYFQ